jgi:2-dehydro-3-deoxygalactonokinase
VKHLVAVDWGTSSLRVARIGDDGTVLDERASDRGILTVPAGSFPELLRQTCGDWLDQPDVLCLVSGMAGSRQGWQEAPYCACPVGFADLARALTWIVPGRLALVPGLSFEFLGTPDALRGEELQVFGAMDLLQLSDGVFVLPGTHCKWVRVSDGRVQSFATFMSGVMYGLLRHHSILARTMPPEDAGLDAPAFLRGVRHAQQARSLLHSAFSARTLALFGRLRTEVLPSYLSGLVIGEELRARALHGLEVVLIGAPVLTGRYALALRTLGCESRSLGTEATWRGHWALARNLQKR